MIDCQRSDSSMDHFMEMLEKNAYEKCIPLNGTFELTARCNFDCNMCYVHLNERQIKEIGRELTNEEWLEIARQAKDAGMLYLTLTGGEVFARPHFRELYEALSDMGFFISILSNGYLVDEKVIAWLKERPPHMLRFTLYGASNETYEKVCGVKDGFDCVSHAIDLVKEAEIPFYMVSTLVKENEDDFEKMYKFAQENKICFEVSPVVVKPVRGAERDVEKHRITWLKDYIKESDNRKEKKYENMQIHHILEHCGHFRKAFVITWNGNLELCTLMNEPYVSMIDKEFKKAWKELLYSLIQMKLPKECDDCKYSRYCQRCPGILSAECGNYDQVSKEFCDRAKKIYEEKKEMFK